MYRNIAPNIAPHIAMGVFKGFLSNAYPTDKYLESEIDFLINIFTENRHNRNTLTMPKHHKTTRKQRPEQAPRTIKTS